MTSQQRHLKDLLKEDQEPFHHLTLKNQHPRNLQLNRKKTVKQNASFPAHFCKNACFFSKFQVDSPDYLRNSPLLSPAFGAKSPTRAAFLHVPAKTAALLLEAACRVQKNSSASASAQKKIKPKTHIRNSGFGLFGSVIKRLTNRARTRKIETGVSIQPADDVIRWADSVKRSSVSRRDEIRVGSPDISVLVEDQTGFSNARLSSVWSEENKSLTSSSSSSTCCSTSASGNISEEEREEKIGFVNPLDKDIGRNLDDDFTFCLSPLSPFRFALQKSPSTGRRSPAFCSPAGSPSRRKFQEHGSYEDQDPSVEEEEKEQCSPVSILDPPFGDDGEEEEDAQAEDEDEFDMECSYAFVQRAKQHLLQKLRNFEKLAKLDPVELERRMAEEEEETDDDLPTSVVDVQGNIECYLVDIAGKSGIVEDLLKPGMKRLLQDLISEEEKTESSGANYESLMKRLESWKEVEAKTIEMMVAMDLKGENSTWKKPREEEITETAKMVEFSILGALLEELLEEVTMC